MHNWADAVGAHHLQDKKGIIMAKKTMYTLPKDIEINGEVLKTLITSKIRKADISHYNRLEAYYSNEAITSREAPHELLAVTNHARYISKTNVGYLLGNPVSYSATEGLDIQKILDAYKKQTISNLDTELADHASIFGHAFERIYVDEEKTVESAKIDPRNIILVYDNTVKHNKLFAVIYSNSADSKGNTADGQYDVTILTKSKVIEGTLKDSVFTHNPEVEHAFGEVPVIEYLNGNDRMGDFEPVIPLIDSYNIIQSDRILDRERLVDAILAFYGVQFSREQQEQLKDSRILHSLPADANVEFITKSIDEADAEVLRAAIKEDIHKISMTPDMSDENFAGNSSGVALLYKLLAFEQHVKEKERYFETGLMSRFRIYNAFFGKISNMSIVPVEDVDAIFKRSLPQNDLEISQIINNLTGIVGKETLVSQLSFVRDPKEEIKLAESEKPSAPFAFNQLMAGAEIEDKNKTEEPEGER